MLEPKLSIYPVTHRRCIFESILATLIAASVRRNIASSQNSGGTLANSQAPGTRLLSLRTDLPVALGRPHT